MKYQAGDRVTLRLTDRPVMFCTVKEVYKARRRGSPDWLSMIADDGSVWMRWSNDKTVTLLTGATHANTTV